MRQWQHQSPLLHRAPSVGGLGGPSLGVKFIDYQREWVRYIYCVHNPAQTKSQLSSSGFFFPYSPLQSDLPTLMVVFLIFSLSRRAFFVMERTATAYLHLFQVMRNKNYYFNNAVQFLNFI